MWSYPIPQNRFSAACYTVEQCLIDYRLALLDRFGSLISPIAALPFTREQIQIHIDIFLPRNCEPQVYDIVAVMANYQSQ